MTSSHALTIAEAAKVAFEMSQVVPASERVNALHEIKKELAARKDAIFAANRADLQVSHGLLLQGPTYCG